MSLLIKTPLVIFATAYENYALEGYELDIVDYLVKPIRFERFLKAINKAHKLFNLNNQFDEKQSIEYLTIKVEYKNVKIVFHKKKLNEFIQNDFSNSDCTIFCLLLKRAKIWAMMKQILPLSLMVKRELLMLPLKRSCI